MTTLSTPILTSLSSFLTELYTLDDLKYKKKSPSSLIMTVEKIILHDLPSPLFLCLLTVYYRLLLRCEKYEEIINHDQNQYNKLEVGYALYRLTKYNECIDLLRDSKNKEELQLVAQCWYKIGNYQGSSIYIQLLASENENDNIIMMDKRELLTNALATRISNWSGVINSDPILKNLLQMTEHYINSDNYELMVNYVIGLLINNNENRRKALQVLENINVECVDKKDIPLIECMKIIISDLLGINRKNEYQKFLHCDNENVKFVSHQNSHLVEREFKNLTPIQQIFMLYNQGVHYGSRNELRKKEEKLKILQQCIQQKSFCGAGGGLYWKVILAILGEGNTKLDQVLEELSHKQGYERDYAFTYGKFYQLQQKFHDCKDTIPNSRRVKDTIQVLLSLPRSIRNQPAIVSNLATLLINTGNVQDAKNVLKKYNSVINTDNNRSQDLLHTMKHLSIKETNWEQVKIQADQYVHVGFYQDAVNMYKTLLQDSSDIEIPLDILHEVHGRYIYALSFLSPEAAQEAFAECSSWARNLATPLLSSKLSSDELEQMQILYSFPLTSFRTYQFKNNSSSPVDHKVVKQMKKEHTMQKRARKREKYKVQLQKQGKYNEEYWNQPDPERWIPKQCRKHRKRGRKGKYSKYVGSQGVMNRNVDLLDVAKKLEQKQVSKEKSEHTRKTAHLQVSQCGGRKR